MTTGRTDIPSDPGERWVRTPRPFSYVRPRLDRDEAEWLLDQLQDIKTDAFADVEELRAAGRKEDDKELAEAVRDANYAVKIIKQVDRAYIDMLGPRAPEGQHGNSTG